MFRKNSLSGCSPCFPSCSRLVASNQLPPHWRPGGSGKRPLPYRAALQAIAAAGGFTDSAQPSTVALLGRGPSGTWRSYTLALDETIWAVDPNRDTVLQPGTSAR